MQLQRLKTFLQTPVFPGDEEKTRQARTLNALLLSQFTIISLLGGFGLFFLFAEKIISGSVIVFAACFTLAMKGLLNRGRVRPASLANGIVTWSIVTGLVSISGGLTSADTYVYFPLVVGLGLTAGLGMALVFGLLSILTLLGMTIAESLFAVQFPRLLLMPPQSRWMLFTISMLWMAVPLYISLKRLSEAFENTQKALEEQKRAEQALLKSEERYRLITSVSSDFLFSTRLHPDGRLEPEWVAGAFENITGYTFEEYKAIGGWPAIVHPDDHESDEADMAALHANRKITTEVRIRQSPRLGSGTRYLRVYAHPVWDAERQVLVGIYGASQDITEARLAEANLERTRRSEQELYQSSLKKVAELTLLREAALISASDASEDALLRVFVQMLNTALKPDIFGIALWDEEAQTLHGHPASQGLNPEVLATPIPLGATALGRVAQTRQPLRQGRGAADEAVQSEIVVPIEAGDRLIGVIGVMSRTPDQFTPEDERLLLTLAGQLATAIERRRALQSLRQLNAELEERVARRTTELEAANRELDAFSYSVSHDLRAPLRAIDGFSAILAQDFTETLDPAAQQFLLRIRENTQRMNQLINGLLNLSRLGRQPIQKAPVDPAHLAQESLDELQPELAGRSITVQIHPMPSCLADPTLLRQVYSNLLGNAVKYTRHTLEALVEVGAEQRGAETIYFVRDNGVGFDMAYADKLFGVFQRLHAQSEFEGSGVGLATVKRILDRHGGRIWAEAQPGEGACFYFVVGGREQGIRNKEVGSIGNS